MKFQITAAVLAAAITLPATAQTPNRMTGVSHPEPVPTNSAPMPPAPAATAATAPDATPQPEVYLPYNPTGAPLPAAETRPVLTASVATPKLTQHPDADADIVLRVPGPSNQLPVGTTIKVRINEALSTRSTVAGANFSAELIAPIIRDGRVLLPPGSILSGHITEVHGGKRISGRASMHLTPQQVTLPDGTVYPLHAQVIDTDLYKATKVDPEGTILRKGSKTGTATGIGLSTGAGAASGALLGGWPGAIIGAGVGAGVSTVVWLKQDRQTELPSGTGITFQLTAPVLVDGK